MPAFRWAPRYAFSSWHSPCSGESWRGDCASAAVRLSANPPARRDDPGIHPDQIETPKEASMLDLDTAVHDDLEPRLVRDPRRFLVDDVELQPEHPGVDLHRLAGDRGRLVSAAEDIDD